MIVTCEACETQFQLDDAKVPEGGIRVRCSRCKHAFKIESPRRPDEDAAAALARDALAPDPPLVASPAERAGEDDESDWQFNEEVASGAASPEPPRTAAEAAVDDLLGGEPPSAPEPAAVSAPDDDLDIDPRVADEGLDLGGSDFGVPDLDLAGDEPGSDDLLADDPDALAVDPASPDDLSLDPGSPDDLSLAADEESFDDFDLGMDDDEPALAAAPGAGPFAPDSSGIAVARMRHEVPAELSAEARGGKRRRAEPELDFDAEPDAGSAWMARVRGAVGWACVIGLLAYGAWAGLGPAASAGGTPASVQAVGGMLVEDVEGHWIENAAAGPLYVISGWLRPVPARPVEPGLQLRIRLLDPEGGALVSVSSPLGPPLRQDQLREWNLADLRELHERRSLRMAWQPLGATERRPFQALLADVPSAAAAFEFHAVPAASPVPDEAQAPASPFEGGEPGAGLTDAPTG